MLLPLFYVKVATSGVAETRAELLPLFTDLE
jgi:hypothetical protein